MKKKMTIPEVNELGNVLTPEEMKEITDRAYEHKVCSCTLVINGVFEKHEPEGYWDDLESCGEACARACKKGCTNYVANYFYEYGSGSGYGSEEGSIAGSNPNPGSGSDDSDTYF